MRKAMVDGQWLMMVMDHDDARGIWTEAYELVDHQPTGTARNWKLESQVVMVPC